MANAVHKGQRGTALLAGIVLSVIAVIAFITTRHTDDDLPPPFLDSAVPASASLAPPPPATASGPADVPVAGTVAGLAPDDVVWVVSIAEPRDADDGFVPAPGSCGRGPDGAFDCGVFPAAGPPGSDGSFDMLVLRTTEAAANELIEFMAAGNRGGLAELPDGVQEIGRVEVRSG